MVKRFFYALIVCVLTACASTPSPTATAVPPLVSCEQLSLPWSTPIHLTCNPAVAAAQIAVAAQIPASEIARIDFHYGAWCRPGTYCGLSGNINIGYVIIYSRVPGVDLVVLVSADENRVVTATLVEPFPTPLALSSALPHV